MDDDICGFNRFGTGINENQKSTIIKYLKDFYIVINYNLIKNWKHFKENKTTKIKDHIISITYEVGLYLLIKNKIGTTNIQTSNKFVPLWIKEK